MALGGFQASGVLGTTPNTRFVLEQKLNVPLAICIQIRGSVMLMVRRGAHYSVYEKKVMIKRRKHVLL